MTKAPGNTPPVIDPGLKDIHWWAVNYLYWYGHREFYALSRGHDRPPFVFGQPRNIMRSRKAALKNWVARGCEESLIIACLYVLATPSGKLRLKTLESGRVRERGRKIENAKKALEMLLNLEGRLAIDGECREKGESLLIALGAFLEAFRLYLDDRKDEERDFGRSRYFHKRALWILGNHLEKCVGEPPWTVIEDLVFDLGRVIPSDSLKTQYCRLKSDPAGRIRFGLDDPGEY